MKTHFYFCFLALAVLLTSATTKREKIDNAPKMTMKSQTRVSTFTTLTRKLASGTVVPVDGATVKNLTTGQSAVTGPGGQTALDVNIGDQVSISLPKNKALDLAGQSSVSVTWAIGQPINKTIVTYLVDIATPTAWVGTFTVN